MKLTRKRSLAAADVTSVEELVLAHALEECLDEMERGQTDLDMLAGRFAEARDELRPLLEIAQQLSRERGLSTPLSHEFRQELHELLSHRGAART